MRFTAMAAILGWIKFTDSWAPTLKLCQFRERFWLLWLTVVLPPAWLITPEPAATCPPVGAAYAGSTANMMLARNRLPKSPNEYSLTAGRERRMQRTLLACMGPRLFGFWAPSKWRQFCLHGVRQCNRAI